MWVLFLFLFFVSVHFSDFRSSQKARYNLISEDSMQWHISHPGLPDVMGPAVKILEGA
jgi:hypothetical protein